MNQIYRYQGRALAGEEGEILIREAASRFVEAASISYLPTEELILRTEAGKPYFRGAPFSFSLSHSAGIWMILFSEERSCGLDIQEMKTVNYEKISKWLFGRSIPEKEAFYEAWTRREAYTKLVGGSVFEKTPDLSGPVVLWEGEEYHFYTLSMEEGMMGTMLLRGSAPKEVNIL